MKPFLAGILTLLSIINLKAIENYPSGARARSLSNAFVSISDPWSTFHNQAGLAGLESLAAGFFFESRFMIDELSLASATLTIPTNAGTFGFSFSQFGKGSFKQQKAGLAFSKILSKKFSAGLQLDYFSLQFPENEKATGFATFEAGVIFNATDNLILGTHIFNPINGGFKTTEGVQKMPFIFRLGGHYEFYENVLLILETEKNRMNPLLLKTGLEFSPVDFLALRFGVSGKPVNYTTGIGFKTGKITTDIAFSYHGNLGITPSVSLQFNY